MAVQASPTDKIFHAKHGDDLFYIAPEGACISNGRGFDYVLPDENGNEKIELSALRAMLSQDPVLITNEAERAKRDKAIFSKTYEEFYSLATTMLYFIYSYTDIFKRSLDSQISLKKAKKCEKRINQLRESQRPLWTVACVVKLSAVTSINCNTMTPTAKTPNTLEFSPTENDSWLDVQTANRALKISTIINRLAQAIINIENATQQTLIEHLTSIHTLLQELEPCIKDRDDIRLEYTVRMLKKTPLHDDCLTSLVLSYSHGVELVPF